MLGWYFWLDKLDPWATEQLRKGRTLEHRIIHLMKIVRLPKNKWIDSKCSFAKSYQPLNHSGQVAIAQDTIASEIDLRAGPHPWRVRGGGTPPTLGLPSTPPSSPGFPPHVAPATRGGKGPGSGGGGGGGGGEGGGGKGGLQDYAKTHRRQLLRSSSFGQPFDFQEYEQWLH